MVIKYANYIIKVIKHRKYSYIIIEQQKSKINSCKIKQNNKRNKK